MMNPSGNPLVSVIVPVFNTQDHLRQCLESIRQQTYTQLEIIVVDDGSTDQSPQICDTLAREDGRIHVIHQHNSGVACARNAGLDAACGEYVTFVDSDDWLEPEAVATLMHDAQCSGGDMVIGGYTRHMVGADSVETASEELPNLFGSPQTGGTIRHLNTKDLHDPQCARRVCDLDIAGHLYQCWGKLFRLAWIEGLRFKPGCAYGEDTVFVLEALGRGGVVSVTYRALYDYREDGGGLVRGFRMDKADDFEFSHGKHVDFYKGLPITDDQRLAIDVRLANDVLWAISAVRQAPASVSAEDRLEFIERIMRSPWHGHYLHALKAAHVDRLTKLAFLLNNPVLWRWYVKAGR